MKENDILESFLNLKNVVNNIVIDFKSSKNNKFGLDGIYKSFSNFKCIVNNTPENKIFENLGKIDGCFFDFKDLVNNVKISIIDDSKVKFISKINDSLKNFDENIKIINECFLNLKDMVYNKGYDNIEFKTTNLKEHPNPCPNCGSENSVEYTKLTLGTGEYLCHECWWTMNALTGEITDQGFKRK